MFALKAQVKVLLKSSEKKLFSPGSSWTTEGFLQLDLRKWCKALMQSFVLSDYMSSQYQIPLGKTWKIQLEGKPKEYESFALYCQGPNFI